MGSSLHANMALYFAGDEVKDILDSIDKQYTSLLFSDDEYIRDITKAMIIGHDACYNRSEFETIDVEVEFRVPIIYDANTHKVKYAGVVDAVVKHVPTGKYWLVEHKTTSSITPAYRKRLEIDPQLTMYLLGMVQNQEEPYRDMKFEGIFFNAFRKPTINPKQGESQEAYAVRLVKDYCGRPDFYFFRQECLRNQAELDEMREFLWYRAEELSNPPPDYARNRNHCDSWGGCAFRPLCIEFSDELCMAYERKPKLHPELNSAE